VHDAPSLWAIASSRVLTTFDNTFVSNFKAHQWNHAVRRRQSSSDDFIDSAAAEAGTR
jgi:hypothetical protein